MKDKLTEYIARGLLMLTYAIFFMVQLFYMPGYNSQALQYRYAAKILNQSVEYAEGGLHHQPANSQIKPQLSKRFQLQAIVSGFLYTLQPTLMHCNGYRYVRPRDYLLISSIITDFLRGPPSVA